MIQSMTGHGEASLLENGCSYALELRSLNNRYFKVTIRLPEHLAYLEPEVENLLRTRLGRGTITCALKVNNPSADAAYDVNVAVLRRYVEQIQEVQKTAQAATAGVDLAVLLTLPGVCQPKISNEADQEGHWQILNKLLEAAVGNLIESRKAEGLRIRQDLLAHCKRIAERLENIRVRAPQVVEDYRKKLQARVSELLAESGVTVKTEDLIREVAIFAEKSDVHEEIQRLGSHGEQFVHLCDSEELAGRKLDFISQEMLREANTIASKAADKELIRHVVEIKAYIDRLKEQVQNVE